MNLPSRWSALLPLALMALGCADHPTQPDPGAEPPESEPPSRVLGLMEITLTGITEAEGMTASARFVGPVDPAASETGSLGQAGGLTTQSLTPVGEGDQSGVQLERLGAGSFTLGPRPGGQRYLSATFRVRNASSNGVAYTTPLENLTFLAVDTDGTIGRTPVSRLRLFDGSPAPTSLADGLKPTGAAALGATGVLASSFPDVLQVLTETEADGVAGPGTNVFPYGFVTRRPDISSSRRLPESPDADRFDGVVTFAFRLPLEDDPADDPFEISVVVMAVSDSETRITQSPAERTCSGQTALQERAESLAATTVTLLPDGGYGGEETTRVVSQVRTAGTPGAATSELPDSWTPPMRRDAVFTLDEFDIPPGTTDVIPLIAGVIFDPDTEEVEAFFGFYSGHELDVCIPIGRNHFQPSPSDRLQSKCFSPGLRIPTFTVTFNSASTPEIEWLLHDGEERIVKASNDPALYLDCRPEDVPSRAAGIADFAAAAGSPIAVGNHPRSVAVGDVDGDGDLDLVAANSVSDDVTLLLGDGDGGFEEALGSPFGVGDLPISVALGDVDGDGDLDIVTANVTSHDVTVLLRDGSGGFDEAAGSPFGVGDGPRSVALGDVDSDGALDLVTTNADTSDDVTLLLGDGSGGFHEASESPFGVGDIPQSVALGDVDADGDLDMVTANRVDNSVTLLLGDGSGGFDEALESPFAVGLAPVSVALGDVDGDGDLDLATTNDGSSDVTVLLGDGIGGFAEPASSPFAVGQFPRAAVLGDVDGDGDLDIVTADHGPAQVTVLLGRGTGGFAAATNSPFAVDTDPEWLALGDLDADGALDIVTANRLDNVTVLLNETP